MRAIARFLCPLAAAAVLWAAAPTRADAQDYFSVARKTYQVQVEYWFFDTDYYYWKTVFETTDQADAEFFYELLLLAKQNGQLNQAAPNEYWRYIAVDVRMVVKYQYPAYQPRHSSLSLSEPVLDGLLRTK